MATIATLLSGGECVGVGARAAGLTHLWGFEIEDAIAQVARDNGFNVITADVMELDPATLEVPDVLHVSPVCKRASGANQSAELNEDGTKEAPEDIAMGGKIAQFIDVMTPRIFTLENVYAYRNFKAFKLICAALERNGYMWDFDNLNAADYSVPQTRRRLILRAVRGALLPNLPQSEKWVGWYEAIEDLIPGLPGSQFAKWQLERLPEDARTFISPGGNAWTPPTDAIDPIFTIQSSSHSLQSRAFIIANGKYGNDLVISDESEPSFTVTANSNQTGIRAYLVSDQSAHAGQGVQVVDDSAPFFSIRAGENGGSYPKALLVGDEYGSPNNTGKDRILFTRETQDPAMTVKAQAKSTVRAWLSQGRVVSMTPRALARFQSIPDSYRLPESKSLACKVIGNGVCPLLYQKIIGALTQ